LFAIFQLPSTFRSDRMSTQQRSGEVLEDAAATLGRRRVRGGRLAGDQLFELG